MFFTCDWYISTYTHDIGYRGMTNWNEIIYLLDSYFSQWHEHPLTEFVGNCDWGSWEGVTTFWGFNGREACLVLMFCWSFLARFSKMPKFQKRTDHVRSTWKYANVANIQSYFYGVVLHVWNVAEGHLTSLPHCHGIRGLRNHAPKTHVPFCSRFGQLLNTTTCFEFKCMVAMWTWCTCWNC